MAIPMNTLEGRNEMLSLFDKMVGELRKNFQEVIKLTSNIRPFIISDVMRNLERMSYHCHLVPSAYYMTGLPRFPQRFRMDPPAFHMCDINEVVKYLNETRQAEDYPGAVYVNACADGKYYVGFANYNYVKDVAKTPLNAAKARYASHLNNGGGSYPTYWTHLYPVSGLLYVFPGGHEDENLMTILVAACVGWENVRGGKWTSATHLPDYPKEIYLDRILQGLGVAKDSEAYRIIMT